MQPDPSITPRRAEPAAAPGSFWMQRLSAHGHTGWSDQFIYAYDQLERLAIVSSVLDGLPESGGTRLAIDFGCGTGDFSRLLLSKRYEVCGYDTFVQPRITSTAFSHAGRYDEIPFDSSTAALVLSVTVLDHLLDDAALDGALGLVRDKLRSDGHLILLEYALDSEADRTREMRDNPYQAFRTVTDWQDRLAAHGLRREMVRPVPHPVESPSPGFRVFRRSLVVRAVARLGIARLAPALAGRLLRGRARWLIARHPVPREPGPSPLKLMVFRPAPR